jgi:6-phosphofructokinase 1
MVAAQRAYELTVTCVPKTIDNDLAGMDHCPGYGSAARFLAQATADAGRDTEAMRLWDPIKIVEVMGRNAGWLAAATSLAGEGDDGSAPHLIYVPERPLAPERFLADVERVYRAVGHAVIVVAETVRDEQGQPFGQPRAAADAFGHPQLAGTAAALCGLIGEGLGLKARFDKPGTIQRMSMVCASPVDVAEAELAGREAVRLALEGPGGRMVALDRAAGEEYRLALSSVPLEQVANAQRTLPDGYLNATGNGATAAFRAYARPLLGGPLLPYTRLGRRFRLDEERRVDGTA